MLDIHAHLYWKSFDIDRAEVIKRAREAGVERIICVAATVEESKLSVALANEYDLKASVGIHPEFFNTEKDFDYSHILKNVRMTAQDKKVVAVGECGLEYFSHDPAVTISPAQKEAQKKGFLMQIDLAQELGLPVIIHCRPARNNSRSSRSDSGGDAYEDMVEILRSRSAVKAFILHCYMGDTEVTRKFLDIENVFFSFTGNITYPVKKAVAGTKDDLTETVKMIPLERLFVETDCPFLAPQPERGKRNEPAFVKYIFEKVSELHGKDVKTLESVVEENYRKVFNA